MKKETSRFSSSPVFEGMVSIRAILNSDNSFNDRQILKILYDKDHADSKRRELSYLKEEAKRSGFILEPSDSTTINEMTVGQTHGGIIALCSERTIPILKKESLKEDGFYVLIEGIEDPYNFGYAIRSLYAAGADGIILSPRNWMSAAGVVCRSSAGTSELLPLYEADSQSACQIFKDAGYKVICAGIRDSVSAWSADLKKPLLLIVGGEKRGISRALLDEADQVVRLDYGRPFHASLSAASAASILGYEVLRQNQTT